MSSLALTDLSPLLEAVQQAAELCHRVQESHLFRHEKVGQEPVTIADYGAQVILCRALQQAFPGDRILAEEKSEQFLQLLDAAAKALIVELVNSALSEHLTLDEMAQSLDYGSDQQSSRVWVIDPIDGTKGFLARRRYTIAIGLLEDNQPVGGIMGCPGYPIPGTDQKGKLVYALNGEVYSQPLVAPVLDRSVMQSVHVSRRTPPDTLRVVESVEAEHTDHSMIGQVFQLLGLGTPHVEYLDGQDKYAMIACGDGDIYLRIPPRSGYFQKAWDHAAGVALVQTAGGTVSDLDGSPIDFSCGALLSNNKIIVATNGPIHEALLGALRQIMNPVS